MTTTMTYIKAQEQTNDLLREAQRHRRHVEVRRVAVIRLAGSHFKLLPIRASLEATGVMVGLRTTGTDRSPFDRLRSAAVALNPLA